MEEDNKNIKLPFFGIPKILPYVKKYYKKMILMTFMALLVSVFDALYPLFNRYAINHFIAENTTDTLVIFIVIYISAVLIQDELNELHSSV